MMNEDMQQQNGDVPQKPTPSAEIQEEKASAPGRLEKCLRRAGQGLCIILAACFVGAVREFLNIQDRMDRRDACVRAQKDAYTIIGNIADYFAIPAHTSLGPTPIFIGPQACMKNGIQFSALRGKNTGKITGDINKVTISVLDASGRCLKAYQEANSGWNNGVFTKTIP